MKKNLIVLFLLSLFFSSAYAQTPKAVLQYYNTVTHKHFYTTSGTEVTPGQSGWTQLANLGSVYSSQFADGKTIYRFYQSSSSAHYYSNSSTVAPGGFHLEGVLGFESVPPGPAQKAVYEFFDVTTGDYFYSQSNAVPSGYQLNGRAFYVF